MYDSIYLVIIGIVFIAILDIYMKFRSYYIFFSRVYLSNGLSGKEIAESMLNAYGIKEVKVVCSPQNFFNYYDQDRAILNLTKNVYNKKNLIAAVLASQECGHAILHIKKSNGFEYRSIIVPIIIFCSRLFPWILLLGLVFFLIFLSNKILIVSIILYFLNIMFSFFAFPIEYIAGKKALNWLEHTEIVNPSEFKNCKKAFRWVSYIYIIISVCPIVKLINLSYYLLIGKKINNF